MNHTALIRRLSLAFAGTCIATASMAASLEDQQLSDARHFVGADAQVAVDLQAWIDHRDIALLAQADGLITNDMRASAAEYAVAQLVEADGLISAQLREQVEYTLVARLAAADGLVVASAELAPTLPEPTPAVRALGAVVAATGR